MTIDRRSLATTVLMSAMGLAVAAGMTTASAQSNPTMQQKLEKMLKMHPGADAAVIKSNMARVKAQHLVKCYGINAVGKNDCAAGAHSCAGQATRARDPNSFVLVPSGTCGKIAGGSRTGPA